MMNVLIILGHPRTDSYCAALADAYRRGAEEAGVTVREIALAELEFEPSVYADCPSEQELEEDLARAQQSITWADHLVMVYPNWWGTMPAMMKGFFDRVFMPGFAFSYYENGEGEGWEELLKGKTAELISTMDTPPWVYRWIYRQPGNNALKRATLQYAGVRTTRITNLGVIEESSLEERRKWLAKVHRLGRSLHDGPEFPAHRVRRKVLTWLKALRLQFYPMTWVAYTIGAAAAAGSAGIFSSGLYWLGFLFLFFLEAATVLSNEYFDYRTDQENTFYGPFTGGSRVLVDQELGFREIGVGTGVCLLLAGLFGAWVLALTPGTMLAVAAAMAIMTMLALGYTIPPLKLSYRTLGELDVGITHSIGVLMCGYLFLGGAWHDALPWLVGLPLLLATLPSITLAGIPDVRADRQAGKKTLAVRFGPRRAVVLAMVATWLGALAGVAVHVFGWMPAATSWVIYVCIPHALFLTWMMWRFIKQEEVIGRIDGLMAASLSYVLWFGFVPLFNLL